MSTVVPSDTSFRSNFLVRYSKITAFLASKPPKLNRVVKFLDFDRIFIFRGESSVELRWDNVTITAGKGETEKQILKNVTGKGIIPVKKWPFSGKF